MKKRNTVQKQIILDSIKNTKSHPTVNELYEIVKQKDDTIGKATIYRNLNTMIDDGSVKVILTNNEAKRYDGDMSNHDHFICERCDKVIDILDKDNINYSPLEKKYGFVILNENTTYTGICKNCLEKEEEL